MESPHSILEVLDVASQRVNTSLQAQLGVSDLRRNALMYCTYLIIYISLQLCMAFLLLLCLGLHKGATHLIWGPGAVWQGGGGKLWGVNASVPGPAQGGDTTS